MNSPISLLRAHRRATLRPVVAAAAVIGLLTACAAPAEAPTAAESQEATAATGDVVGLLEEHGLADLTGRELVDTLDALPVSERPEGLSASVRADAVLLADGHDHTAEVPIEGDQVYVSIAPYQSQTHDCYYHNATGCRSELADEPLAVSITDAAGQVVFETETQTFDNGFAGLWLPRGIEGTLTVEYDELTATSPISTSGEDVQTCITTLPLS